MHRSPERSRMLITFNGEERGNREVLACSLWGEFLVVTSDYQSNDPDGYGLQESHVMHPAARAQAHKTALGERQNPSPWLGTQGEARGKTRFDKKYDPGLAMPAGNRGK